MSIQQSCKTYNRANINPWNTTPPPHPTPTPNPHPHPPNPQYLILMGKLWGDYYEYSPLTPHKMVYWNMILNTTRWKHDWDIDHTLNSLRQPIPCPNRWALQFNLCFGRKYLHYKLVQSVLWWKLYNESQLHNSVSSYLVSTWGINSCTA